MLFYQRLGRSMCSNPASAGLGRWAPGTWDGEAGWPGPPATVSEPQLPPGYPQHCLLQAHNSLMYACFNSYDTLCLSLWTYYDVSTFLQRAQWTILGMLWKLLCSHISHKLNNHRNFAYFILLHNMVHAVCVFFWGGFFGWLVCLFCFILFLVFCCCCQHSPVKNMNVRNFGVRVIECMCTQTRPWSILSSKEVIKRFDWKRKKYTWAKVSSVLQTIHSVIVGYCSQNWLDLSSYSICTPAAEADDCNLWVSKVKMKLSMPSLF